MEEKMSTIETRLTTKVGEIKKDVESLEIEKRRSNIVIHGLKEGDDDLVKVKEILSQGLKMDSERHVSEIYRIGQRKDDKIRPVRVTLKSFEGKMEIIKRAKTTSHQI